MTNTGVLKLKFMYIECSLPEDLYSLPTNCTRASNNTLISLHSTPSYIF